MDEIKMNTKGQITIPKSMREELGWNSDIPLAIDVLEGEIVLRPSIVCPACKKALPEAYRKEGRCPGCPPPKIVKVY